MTIKIIIAEDHELTRQGIVYGLKQQRGFEIISEVDNGESAIEAVKKCSPDIVLMDIVMPVKSGIEATKEIKEKYPTTKIIMLTSHNEKEKVLSAFSCGADAYCMKNIKIDWLAQIIEMVKDGAVWLDPSISSYLLDLAVNRSSEPAEPSSNKNDFNLTIREKEILKLISGGLNNKDIAEQYSLSLYTVKNHVSNIIQKLAVDDRTQAAIMAIKENLI